MNLFNLVIIKSIKLNFQWINYHFSDFLINNYFIILILGFHILFIRFLTIISKLSHLYLNFITLIIIFYS
jgi:hypothetical protein